MSHPIGLGCPQFTIAAYIENRPNMLNYPALTEQIPLVDGEIQAISQACGNGWRKVFNVYAKLLYALDTTLFPYALTAPSWQAYRDQFLLQQGSHTALLFSPPQLSTPVDSSTTPLIRLIMGRTYAKRLITEGKLTAEMHWLDHEFAINAEHRVIICPYFDYRQLSNIKITHLAELMKQMMPGIDSTLNGDEARLRTNPGT
ncbi:DUF6942 family protein [Photobacterium atrarenae]|uniref:Uncharacterized protein n=1 Tax=Photobacterium atrarenae TaxID=865757 RepID=A0ABY5GMD3_9GAMM|nr:hypothetical protein [Photobacterium atrarenae]UTV29712.1 hypothetical protein NNL38_22135 [Photobacterium atrarenae]